MKRLISSLTLLGFFVFTLTAAGVAFASINNMETIKGRIISIDDYLKKNNTSNLDESKDFKHNNDKKADHSHVYKINLQSDVYGRTFALETYDGRIYYFVRNDRSKSLISNEDYIGKEVVIQGYKLKVQKMGFPSYVDVVSYEVDGKKMSWCEKCNSMGPKHSH